MPQVLENELLPSVTDSMITPETQQLLIDRFTPFLEQAKQWKEKAESLVVTDISQEFEMKMAREARLAIRQIRIQADKTRKELKEDSLRYGRAVQSVYNVIEAVIEPIEKHLEAQEKFKELYEMKQREQLRIEREELVKDVREYIIANLNLGEITQEDFDNMLAGARLQKEAAIQAAQKAEAERIEAERLAAIKREEERKAAEAERERLRIENERLREEAEKLERIRQQEMQEREAERKAAEEKAAFDRSLAEAKAQREREEREKAEAKLREIEAEKQRIEAERIAKEEAELSKGDEQKFADLISELDMVKNKYQFKSKKYKDIQSNINVLINKIIAFASEKVGK